MKDRWEHNGVVYVDAHEIIKELEKENKRLSRNWEEEIEACMGWWKKSQELEKENKNLKEELSKLKEKYGDLDY